MGNSEKFVGKYKSADFKMKKKTYKINSFLQA